MQCPACSHALTERTVDSISVDVCEGGCAGIWFDSHELQKVDEKRESAGEQLITIDRNGVKVDHEARRNCPCCDEQIMMRHFVSVKREVEIDECPSCGGVWLDHGELGRIREQYASEEERKAAAKAYFQETFGDELAKMHTESAEKAVKAERFAHIFKWICPTAWLPGKQDWGAF